MKKQLRISFILLLFSFILFSQENSNFSLGFESNSQYYVDDSKTGDFTLSEPFRANNYLKIDYTFGDFYSGLQVESYAPLALLNYSPKLKNTTIALYHIGYKSEKLDITAGYFYEQFGSGLILRFWEDRQLGVNNALRGGRLKYNPTNYIYLTALYGKQRVGFKVSNGEIFGFNSDIDLSSAFNLGNTALLFGFSYVGRKEKSTITLPAFNDLTNAFSTRLDYSKNNFYSSLEYVLKENDAVFIANKIRSVKSGNSFLLNLGYGKKGIGIDVTFRRMENMSFFSNRAATGNIYNESIINYLPALTKQHDYLLTNIYVYQAQPQIAFQDPTLVKFGEIGGQIDFFYKFKRKTTLGGKYGTKIAINTSYWSGLKGNFDFSNFDYSADFLAFGEKYFSETSLEVRKKWSTKWNSIFYYVNQSYNKRYVEETFGKVNSNIIVAEATYKLGGGKSLRIETQHLWTKNDKKNWIGGTLEINLNQKIAFYVNDIYNYENESISERIHYYNIGGSYTKGASRFALNYGRQRGGLLCVGGVCRYVPESTGISANIIMSF